MRYSIKSKDRIYVRGISNKYSQKLLDSAKKYTTDEVKTASKESFKKLQRQMVI